MRVYAVALDPIPVTVERPWLLLRNGREHSSYATREAAEEAMTLHQEADYLDRQHGW